MLLRPPCLDRTSFFAYSIPCMFLFAAGFLWLLGTCTVQVVRSQLLGSSRWFHFTTYSRFIPFRQCVPVSSSPVFIVSIICFCPTGVPCVSFLITGFPCIQNTFSDVAFPCPNRLSVPAVGSASAFLAGLYRSGGIISAILRKLFHKRTCMSMCLLSPFFIRLSHSESRHPHKP